MFRFKESYISILLILLLMACNNQLASNTEKMNESEVESWFLKSEWKQEWEVSPDASIDKKEFARQYSKNPERWNKAFQFLAETDLENIEPGKYKLEGDNLFANIDEYKSRNEGDTRFESHKKYADIQYLIKGKELIGVLPLNKMTEISEPYDEEKDLVFYKSNTKNNRLATSENFFIFFPDDAHKPCLKVEDNEDVKKVVIKVRLD